MAFVLGLVSALMARRNTELALAESGDDVQAWGTYVAFSWSRSIREGRVSR